ncbi:MAG TPA: proprotein convertase P-domain-containing protein, partial [Myxococcaceae bacterium]|nr:proprotein convertase P-domain-containing protein [Myxococcaceae bacterium]
MEIRKTQATGPAAAPASTPVSTGASSAPTAAPSAQADSAFSGSSAPAADRLGTSRSGPHVALPSMGCFVPPARIAGPLDLSSGAARGAVETSMNYLNVRLGETLQGDAHDAFSVRSVERDSLGMTHVRLDRMHDGLKVFPEQVIAHLDADGNVKSLTGEVQPIPRTLAAQGGPQLSDEQAKATALKAFGNPTDCDPAVEKVITQAADGSYRVAYHVEATNLGLASGPQRQNYLIDAQTGEVLKNWNQMGGIDMKQIEAAKARQAQGAQYAKGKGVDGEEPPPPPVLKTAEGSATPASKINDNSQVTSSITIDGDDFKAGEVQLDLDIDHTYRGDLVVKLTSPSGKEYVVSNREGGSEDNIKGSFDLSDAFENEPVKGEWKLSVEDKAAQDVGTLNSWKLHFKEKDPNQKPPPPPEKDDTSIYAGTVGIGATQKPDGTWRLLDKSRGNGIETRDAMNRSSGSGSKEIDDANNIWGEATDDPRNAAAVDAQFGAGMTYDFYKDVLGRSSIDGKGEKLLNNVHINQNYVNAFWDGTQMNYGDGDGVDASVLTTLDVAGHEITHGLTERTAGLIYSGESGGLNEAMSDILGGAGVEW